MNETAKHDPDAGFEPAYAAPPLACDAHFHVFGAAERYLYGPDIRYKPPYEPLEAYLKLARRIGFVRYVFVQPSAYGFDNSCMLDGLADSMKPRIARLAKLCQEIGWHLDFLTPGWLVSELMPVLRALPIEFTVAHMGLFPAKDGPGQRGFQEFLKLVGDGSKRCWVKLTGIYRFSTAPDFADVKPIAQTLMQTAPDQLIWGSDFPHLSFHDRVGTIQLYNLLGEWAPDAGMRKRILVDNPARLFGFK
jgi:predicted TIM-barrel fold metal-dependent hydrolase